MTFDWSRYPLFQGGGECGALMRARDWGRHPLGVPDTWPAELRTVVGIALGSRQPMLIVWGPEQTTLYNDGYAAMCGARHPFAFGKPFGDLWFDIWDTVEPIISAAYAGIPTSMDDIAFTMHRNGYPEETHFAFSYTPVRSSDGGVLGMFCACVETTGQVILDRRKTGERQRMLQIFERALGAIAIVTGPDHVFTYANSDYRKMVGQRDVMGRAVAAALPEIVSQGFIGLLDAVRDTGEPYHGTNVPVAFQHARGAPLDARVLDVLYYPLADPAGRIESIFVQALDVTARSRADETQHLLNRELGHRMKNQLALVQAIVNQTLRSASDIDAARTSLGERIAVLANAHDILVAGTADKSAVDAIVRQVVSLHDDPSTRRFRIEGPDLAIASKPALSLSLILHELSTNAAKYGALLGPQGYVSIVWRVEKNPDGDRFALVWEERNGPCVVKPLSFGSGTRLIKAGLSGTSDSTVVVDFAADGLRCEIVSELASFQTEQ